MVDKVRSELAAPGGPFVLIVDDLHELSSAEAAEQLTALLTSLPPDVHAVVATRRDLPLRLHQLRLAGELAEIRAAQLRFTEDETREFLAAAGIALPSPLVAMLHRRTEGWAAGLRLAVLSLAGHPDQERFVAEFSGSDRTVAEYLMAEMLDPQPPEVQRLLLRTSLLDRVNGELADLLTGATGSQRFLLDLEDANAFVVSLDPDRTWFRFHHLFSDLLRLQLRRTIPGDIPDLHRIAARWFAGHAEIAEAIRHRQAAGDWTEATRLLTDHALSLTLDGQAGTVAALLRSLRAGTGEDCPGWPWCTRSPTSTSSASTKRTRTWTWPGRTPPRPRPTGGTGWDGHRVAGPAVGAAARALRQRVRAGERAAIGGRRPVRRGCRAGQRPARARAPQPRRHRGVVAAAGRERTRPARGRRPRPRHRPAVPGVACLAHLGFAATAHSFGLARQRCEDGDRQAARHGWDGEPVIAPAQATLAGILIWTGEFDNGDQWLDRARRATRPGASRASSCSST